MSDMNNLFTRLAAREDKNVAAQLARVNDSTGDSPRDAFIAVAADMVNHRQEAKSPRQNYLVWVAVAAVLLTGMAVGYLFTRTATVDVPVDERSEWVNVGKQHPRQMTFSDGSQVRFANGARARITSNGLIGHTVSLETGRVDLQVKHRPDTLWKVLAGPYTVDVTGTRFNLFWSAERSEMELNLYEGSVVVKGPMMEAGQVLQAGRTLRASVNEERVSLVRLVENDFEQIASPQDVVASSAEEMTPKSTAKPVDEAPNVVRQAPVRARLLDPGALLSQANAARTDGNLNKAHGLYLKIRRQFSGTLHASTAALYLGRMAFDQQRNYRVAAKWLKIYLREQKSGTLHREALGRLMEAERLAGHITQARDEAAKYLSQYPTGPHAVRAEEIRGE